MTTRERLYKDLAEKAETLKAVFTENESECEHYELDELYHYFYSCADSLGKLKDIRKTGIFRKIKYLMRKYHGGLYDYTTRPLRELQNR